MIATLAKPGGLRILPDPWKTLRVSYRSLDGANRAPPTGSTGPTTSPIRTLDTERSHRAG